MYSFETLYILITELSKITFIIDARIYPEDAVFV